MQVWQRPAEPVAQQRKRNPVEEKESYRWLKGYQDACTIKQACPASLVVNMAERVGASRRVPPSGLYGPRCSRRPPWGHSPSPIHWRA